jgi:hypothetical protein
MTETPSGLPSEEDEIPPMGVPAGAEGDGPDELPGLPEDEPDTDG